MNFSKLFRIQKVELVIPVLTAQGNVKMDGENPSVKKHMDSFIRRVPVIFEKTFGLYGTVKTGRDGIIWSCAEKPNVTADLKLNNNVMLLEIYDDDSLAASMAAYYFFFLFTAVISALSLCFFIYMKFFFMNPEMLVNSRNLWYQLDKQMVSLKWYIIFSWSLLPLVIALILVLLKRRRLFLFMKRKGEELGSALEELFKSDAASLALHKGERDREFFDIRMNFRIELPEGYDHALDRDNYILLGAAIDDFFQTGQFKGSLPADKADIGKLADGYSRRSSDSGDYVTSVTLYNYGDSIGIEAREDHSLEWFGTGGRLTVLFSFFWLISYSFTKDLIFNLLGTGNYYRQSSLHIGILFSGFLLIMILSLIAGLIFEVYWCKRRFRILEVKFRKLVDDAKRIVNG